MGHQSRDGVTDARNKADQGVEAKPNICAGDEEGRIEQCGESVDPRDPFSTGARRSYAKSVAV